VKALRTIEHWNALLENSRDEVVVVFKHSNTCPVSTDAFEEVKKFEESENFNDKVYLVVVQAARDISDQIEKDLSLKHESPQIIILKKGKASYNASHEQVKAKDIAKNVV